jgi:predicted transcriptional regulator
LRKRSFAWKVIAALHLKQMPEIQADPMVFCGEEAEVDLVTAAAIERGIQAADQGQMVSSDEVRKLVHQWISRYSTQTQR